VLRKQKNVLVMMGEVTRVDPAAKRVVIGDREIEYAFLIMAPGATHS
jgi:NADH dehydrogenase FAD-containing subunit